MRRLLRYHSNQAGPVQVVAAQFAANAGGVYYPMEWEPDNQGVPGVDRFRRTLLFSFEGAAAIRCRVAM